MPHFNVVYLVKYSEAWCAAECNWVEHGEHVSAATPCTARKLVRARLDAMPRLVRGRHVATSRYPQVTLPLPRVKFQVTMLPQSHAFMFVKIWTDNDPPRTAEMAIDFYEANQLIKKLQHAVKTIVRRREKAKTNGNSSKSRR